MAGSGESFEEGLDRDLQGTFHIFFLSHLNIVLSTHFLFLTYTRCILRIEKQVGANQSNLVTKTSSLGMWLPVHDEEWDGDVPIGIVEGGAKDTPTSGEVVFNGDKLPWGSRAIRGALYSVFRGLHRHSTVNGRVCVLIGPVPP